jgi:predicted transcriptional regulator
LNQAIGKMAKLINILQHIASRNKLANSPGEVSKMKRSKLAIYIDILKVLAHTGPLKLTHIMYKANLNCKVLHKQLDFLIKEGFVENKTIKKSTVFSITQQGLTVLKYFGEIIQDQPIMQKTAN